ncbi:V-type ATP synthase subunit I [Alkalimarinus coralli]|uniref:V-type ATP synthase subunit I n=1 Tax=Alkalimarinus coralli TaxID=2935863 RepID=UPI00202B253E|nr:hypothetical protein [Alkalimarinus coralli]
MSIAVLKKLTLVGDVAAKTEILEAVQGVGAVHLVPLSSRHGSLAMASYDQLKEALAYLNNAPNKRRLQMPTDATQLSEVICQILDSKRLREETLDRIELNRQRIKTLTPWGEFEYPELSKLGGYRLWFYKIPLSKKSVLEGVEIPWKIVNQDHKFYYLVALSKSEPTQEQIPFSRVHVGSLSLSQLRLSREELLVQLENINAERESQTRWILPLTRSLDQTINDAELVTASGMTLDTNACFVLRGWIPESATPQLELLRETLPMAYQLNSVEAEDEPPTLLQNSNRFGGGEEAVSFFQLPGYRSWDPSIMIFFSFSLFFAMILADAGYALLLGGFLGVFWKKMSRSETGIRIRNLAASVIGSAFVYGALVGSYFGITPAADAWLSHLHLLDMNDFKSMMKLSIGAGVLHLVMANIMVAWTDRQSPKMLASIGWILVIGFSFRLWLEYLQVDQFAVMASENAALIASGLLLILLFSSSRKINSVGDLAIRLFDGVKALYGLSKAFGDVLSYMRLFALGLSSASLAVTFNNLAVEARDSVSAGGFILFTLIIVLGHGLNFVLGIMSGVIHGLRLNLLEFYNWGVKGEGYPFKAFKNQGQYAGRSFNTRKE